MTASEQSIEAQILGLAKASIASPEVLKLLEDVTKAKLDTWGIAPAATVVTVKQPKKKDVELGKVHNKFPLVLKCVAARTNVALVGEAGSGKTMTSAKVAEALGLPFYSKSVSLQTGVHEFFGYQDANGNYVRTLFREAYENGGVFLLDEFDAGNPNVLAALNQATANEACAFADTMIKKHKDFVVIMAGNTYGHGATAEYVGRNKIDAATLDRFVFISFPYDEALEMDLATNKAWCRRVQKLRKVAAEKKVKTIISPRATFDGSKLLEQGISEGDVIELTIFKSLNDKERQLIMSGE